MGSNRKVSKVFDINPKGSRLWDDQDTDGGAVYKHILINEKLQIGKIGQETELTGRSPLSSQRSAMDCCVIEEKERKKNLSPHLPCR
jgi:hypothetical protein